MFASLGLCLRVWPCIGRSRFMFAGVGLYLQVWAVACGSELIFAGLGYCLQVWAYLSIPSGFISSCPGLYLQVQAYIFFAFAHLACILFRNCDPVAMEPRDRGRIFAGLGCCLQV